MKIVELKYKAKRFKQLSDQELTVVSLGLLYKINIITGWKLSEMDEAQDVLVDQFKKKLVESYADYNVEEVEFAFRNYGSAVKDWGKQMNLSMIDDVMNPYMLVRSSVSRMEESIKKELPAPTESLEDHSMTDWLTSLKETARWELMPVMLYDWAAKKKIIDYSTERKKEFYNQAISKKFNELLAAAQDFSKSSSQLARDQESLAAFTRMRFNNNFSEAEKKALIAIGKKIALFEYLKTIVNGNIYENPELIK